MRYTWGRATSPPGDVVLVTHMEHHSNIVPWQLLCEEQGARLEYVERRRRGGSTSTTLDAYSRPAA